MFYNKGFRNASTWYVHATEIRCQVSSLRRRLCVLGPREQAQWVVVTTVVSSDQHVTGLPPISKLDQHSSFHRSAATLD